MRNNNYPVSYRPSLPLVIPHRLETLKLSQFYLTTNFAKCMGMESFHLHSLKLDCCAFVDPAISAFVHSLNSPNCVLRTLKMWNAYGREMYNNPPNEILEALGRSSLKKCVVELTSDVVGIRPTTIDDGDDASVSSVEDLIRGLQGNETIEELKIIQRVLSQSSFMI